MPKIRWGILSTGHISGKFVEALQLLPDAEITAVGSRDLTTAKDFAHKFGIPNVYSSYGELAASQEVDVIYIGTPHSHHHENSIMCMNEGKAVLCEKAFSINAREAGDMIRVAREQKVFLMEAMITRHVPLVKNIIQWIKDGLIGEVRMVKASRCARGEFSPEQRHLNPALGGGSLLDVGVYVISFASMVYGKEPVEVFGYGHIGKIGSDEQGVAVLKYDNGALADLSFALRTNAVDEAYILGTEGYIKIDDVFAVPSKAALVVKDEEIETLESPVVANGLVYEAEETMRCLREGLIESPLMTLDESLQIMRTMDKIREPWGLVYPNDKI